MALHQPFLSPQHQQRALQFAVHVRLVVLEIDTGGGAVILAGRVDAGRIAETADVLLQRPRIERARIARPLPQLRLQVIGRVVADQRLRQVVALDQEKPVIVAGRHILIDGREDLVGRHDVEHGELLDPVAMVERHPMPDPAAAIVPGDVKPPKPQSFHHLHLILCHGALGVGEVRRVGGGLAAVTVTAQVAGDDGETLRQPRRDPVPHDVRLRIAVQQQQRRPRAADHGVNGGRAGVDILAVEALEHAALAVRCRSGAGILLCHSGPYNNGGSR